ncbi:hypothetical protein CASFOL_039372 [Castilleja foliolosa]|uniref:Uncharacterized protein n=1 Tax=Castilleja foliolosa TaxID=1961234 RepID=A0ABD3BHT0_9LAMI
MKIGTKPMVEDFQRSVVIERDEKGRQWRGNRRTLIWGVTQFRKTLIEEGNSKSAGTAVLVRGCLVLVDGIGWGGGRFLVREPVDGGALKWAGSRRNFVLVAWRPGDGRRLHLVVTRRWSRHLWGRCGWRSDGTSIFQERIANRCQCSSATETPLSHLQNFLYHQLQGIFFRQAV